MTGFLGKTNARNFLAELWDLLLEAQENPHGIPPKLIELKKAEMKKAAESDKKKVSSSISSRRA